MRPTVAFFPTQQDQAVTLAAAPNAVPLARRLVAEVARHWHLPTELIHDTETIVSELATNALKATDGFHQAMGITEIGRIRLRLKWTSPSLFTEVWDINPVLPTKRQPNDLDLDGRGLGIIEMLSARWAAVHCKGGGKIVWAEQRLCSY
ncbi:ATP-binding protein [Actinoallomurus sp. NPDC052274]|uniref:ATP-binding protein n=1 Tax=Actinoallomurus sp. NPDC052274 TaxID=3155420 RepID=UPI0034490924